MENLVVGMVKFLNKFYIVFQNLTAKVIYQTVKRLRCATGKIKDKSMVKFSLTEDLYMSLRG